jgi:hypothetical protein
MGTEYAFFVSYLFWVVHIIGYLSSKHYHYKTDKIYYRPLNLFLSNELAISEVVHIFKAFESDP